MKIIADNHMPLLAETFGQHGELHRLSGREICAADLTDAEVLLVRSVTRVNANLLRGSSIRFVGSATIGIDHLDTHWLEANNINWAHAPGCNADAAAQYSLAMMWLACERLKRNFRQQTVGIIGRGNVGSRLDQLLKTLNIPVLCCDPPLQDRGEQQLVSMDEACSSSIISVHVPLTQDGNYTTKYLFDTSRLGKLRPDVLLVNTSRGGVIEKTGLLARLQSGQLKAALDVWPDEPFIEPELLDLVTVATPHVAGYSREGKQAGTEMIYQAFCRTFALSPVTDTVPGMNISVLDICSANSADDVLKQSIQSSSQVGRDDALLRGLPAFKPDDLRLHIDGVRAVYPDRYEFKSYRVPDIACADTDLLAQLGFKTS
jgi:erythronate-4-phosphate dehydrogenase